MKNQENKNYLLNKEAVMICTGKYKMFGELEDQAEGITDIEEYVWDGGVIVPREEAEKSGRPKVQTAKEPNLAEWKEM